MKTLTASDRSALIRLASELPKGSEERKAILAGLSRLNKKPLAKQKEWLQDKLGAIRSAKMPNDNQLDKIAKELSSFVKEKASFWSLKAKEYRDAADTYEAQGASDIAKSALEMSLRVEKKSKEWASIRVSSQFSDLEKALIFSVKALSV